MRAVEIGESFPDECPTMVVTSLQRLQKAGGLVEKSLSQYKYDPKWSPTDTAEQCRCPLTTAFPNIIRLILLEYIPKFVAWVKTAGL